MNTDKQRFTKQLFKKIADDKYVVLKHLDEKMDDASYADIDLLVEQVGMDKVVAFTSKHDLVGRWIRKDNSSMAQLFIHFKDKSF